jgi:hypothetical protein
MIIENIEYGKNEQNLKISYEFQKVTLTLEMHSDGKASVRCTS